MRGGAATSGTPSFKTTLLWPARCNVAWRCCSRTGELTTLAATAAAALRAGEHSGSVGLVLLTAVLSGSGLAVGAVSKSTGSGIIRGRFGLAAAAATAGSHGAFC